MTRTGAQAIYLLSRFPVGIIGFVVLVTLFSVGIGTAVIGIGFVVLMLLFHLVRFGAIIERDLVELVGGPHIPTPYRPLGDGFGHRWRTRLTDPATYRDILFTLLQFPLGIVNFVILTVAAALPLGAMAAPFYYDRMGRASIQLWGPIPVISSMTPEPEAWLVIDSLRKALGLAAVGIVAALFLPLVIRAMAAVNFAVARLMLSPAPGQQLGFGGQTDLQPQDDLILG